MKNIRYILIAVTLLLHQLNGQAQVKIFDTALYKVTYKSIYAYDTTDLSKKLTETMNLYIGRSYSVFRDARYELYEQARAKVFDQMKAQAATHDVSKPITLSTDLRTIPSGELFKKIDGNTAYKKRALSARDYLVEDKLPQIQWKIDAETKMFGDIKCQKARGYFRGRWYTAWFASEFPLSAGPWKLNGLPGIILEAWDEKKEVIFTFESFESLQKKSPTVISLPDIYIKASADDFEKLENVYRENPQAFVANQRMQNGVNVTVTVGGKKLEELKPNQPKKQARSPFNNPLEPVKD